MPMMTDSAVPSRRRLCAITFLQASFEHRRQSPKRFMRSSTRSAVGSLHLVDDAPVGQEDDAVGVGRRRSGRG